MAAPAQAFTTREGTVTALNRCQHPKGQADAAELNILPYLALRWCLDSACSSSGMLEYGAGARWNQIYVCMKNGPTNTYSTCSQGHARSTHHHIARVGLKKQI